jgi:hypothetical protein
MSDKEYLKSILEDGKWIATEIAYENLTYFDYQLRENFNLNKSKK